MANKLIRRVFIIVMLIVSVFIAALCFKYKNNSRLSPEQTQETAPLFLDEDASDSDEDFDFDDQDAWMEEDAKELSIEELEASDLGGAFEEEDFIKDIQDGVYKQSQKITSDVEDKSHKH